MKIAVSPPVTRKISGIFQLKTKLLNHSIFISQLNCKFLTVNVFDIHDINYPIFLQVDGGINITHHSTSLWGKFCQNLRSLHFSLTSKQAIVKILKLSPNLEDLRIFSMRTDSSKFIL